MPEDAEHVDPEQGLGESESGHMGGPGPVATLWALSCLPEWVSMPLKVIEWESRRRKN
jgi:hypothetical protein